MKNYEVSVHLREVDDRPPAPGCLRDYEESVVEAQGREIVDFLHGVLLQQLRNLILKNLLVSRRKVQRYSGQRRFVPELQSHVEGHGPGSMDIA